MISYFHLYRKKLDLLELDALHFEDGETDLVIGLTTRAHWQGGPEDTIGVRTMPNLLSGLAFLGLPFILWGLAKLEIWPTLVGILFTYAGKVWFLDRMVWLFREMKDRRPEYAAWLYDDTSEPEQR